MLIFNNFMKGHTSMNNIYFALQPDGLQGYVEAMNVFN